MPATHAESFRTVKSRDGSGLGRSTIRVLPLRRAFDGAALAALEALEALAELPAADRDDDLDRVCGGILIVELLSRKRLSNFVVFFVGPRTHATPAPYSTRRDCKWTKPVKESGVGPPNSRCPRNDPPMSEQQSLSPFENQQQPQQQQQQQRKRLNLKPRDDARAAQLQSQSSLAQQTSSLFGDAKPRERIIADRDGKTEEEVLREEVRKEKLHLRLTQEQNQVRLSAEAAVKEVEEQVEAEADEGRRKALQAELGARRDALDGLMERFAKEVLSEGGKKHVGVPRERYNPTRGSNDGVMMPVGVGGAGGYHHHYHHHHHPNGNGAIRPPPGHHHTMGQGVGMGMGISMGLPQHMFVPGGRGAPPHFHASGPPHPQYQQFPQYHHRPQYHAPPPQGHHHAQPPAPQSHQMVYRGPPAGVGMGGEIEFDAPGFAGSRY